MLNSIEAIEKEIAELQSPDAGEFYGNLVKGGFRTSRFEDVYNFSVRKDNFMVSLVEGKLRVGQIKNE